MKLPFGFQPLNAAQKIYADFGVPVPAGVDDTPPTPVEHDELCIENITENEGTLSIINKWVNKERFTIDVQYCINDGKWTTVNVNKWDGTTKGNKTVEVTVPAGGKVYLRGNNPNGTGEMRQWLYLNMDVNHNVSGHILSMIDRKKFYSVPAGSNPNFLHLFESDNNLISAENLILSGSTVLYEEYNMMFSFCIGLIAAPDMSGITTIEQSGCNCMFSFCTSLTTPPDMSGITTIEQNGCSQMFLNCTSLTTAPDLSSVTSVGNYGCQEMFTDCSLLNYVKCPNINSWNSDNFTRWMTRVSETGTFVKPSSLEIPVDSENGIPTGWTVETY